MGKAVLVARLALRDLRHRPAPALLIAAVITAAMGSLTLGLVLRGVTGQPYQHTRAVTRGPDVVASSIGGGCGGPAGRPRSFDTGLVWVTRAAARSLATSADPLTWYLNLRLASPAAAGGFVASHQPPPGLRPPALTTWRSLRAAAATLVVQERQVLVPASWLLALLAVASAAATSGRMAEQEQRVGLLKAAGGTPALAATVLLAEHLLVAVAAAAAGLAAGWLAAPLLTSPGASLVGSPAGVSVGWPTVALVAGAAIAVTAVSTLVPAVRGARVSTVAALAGSARPPRRHAAWTSGSAWLPVVALLGLRLVTRRPRRAMLSTAGIAVTVTAIVAVLTYHATLGRDAARSGPFAGAPDPAQGRIAEVLLIVTVVMAVPAATNTISTTWATVLDERRFMAIVQAAGATARQAAAAAVTAQLLPALAGGLLGIPVGRALYAAVQHGGPEGAPPVWWLLAMMAGLLVTVAGLAAAPARAVARRPVAGMLEQEG